MLALVEEIASAIEMDAKNIERFVAGPQRTFLLHSIINRLIRGEVVTRYTIVDELLTNIICNYYFKRPKDGHYGRLWKTKRFQTFVQYLMDETFFTEKARYGRRNLSRTKRRFECH